MPRNALEERLEAITREFVVQIVSTLRSASFADVAGLEVEAGARPAPRGRPPGRPTHISASPAASRTEQVDGRKRQTANVRAELAERVVKALEAAHDSMGVRALSSELGIASDLLAAPLKELRAAGRIAKHGEKRATTYSLA